MRDFIKPTRREILAASLALGVCPRARGQAFPDRGDPFVPVDAPNCPIGEGKGIHPGRVVWVHRPEATHWDGKTTARSVEPGATGQWWDDENCDPKIVSNMMSTSLRGLTGKDSDQEAWQALFRHFNRTHGFPEAGYQPGEKISIKINANNDRPSGEDWKWTPGRGFASPQMVQALMRQLVEAGVPGKDIIVYDVANTRYISDPIYERVRSDPDPQYRDIRFVVSIQQAKNGRLAAEQDTTDPIRFSQPGVPTAYVPTCVPEAKYRINMSLFRPHNVAGVTLTTKNNFGSIYFPTVDLWGPRPLHKFVDKKHPMGAYTPFVDLIGHRQLGGKTMLYLIDGMYAAQECEVNVVRYESFGNHWTSCLFASQDPVAIDSVGLDFLRNEPRATPVFGNPDNFLHEAALVENPPSKTKYAPHGEPLTSLGTHEHWNNPKEKKYSRNLGEDKGIELVEL